MVAGIDRFEVFEHLELELAVSTLLRSFEFEGTPLYVPFIVSSLIDHVTLGPLDMLIRREIVQIQSEDDGHRLAVSLAVDRLLLV